MTTATISSNGNGLSARVRKATPTDAVDVAILPTTATDATAATAGAATDNASGDGEIDGILADTKLAKFEAREGEMIATIVDLIVNDAVSATRRYAKIGRRIIRFARWQKGQFAAFAEEDFAKAVGKIENAVKLRATVTVRGRDWAMLAAFLECLDKLFAGIADSDDGQSDKPERAKDAKAIAESPAWELPYNTLVNVLMRPAMSFSGKVVQGELKAGWADWLKAVVARQAGADGMVPYSASELDAELKLQVARVASAKGPKKEAQTDATKKRLAQETSARSKLVEALATAKDVLGAEALGATLQRESKIVGATLPTPKPIVEVKEIQVGLNPATMTVADAAVLVAALRARGSAGLKVIAALHDHCRAVYAEAAARKAAASAQREAKEEAAEEAKEEAGEAS